MSGAYSLSKRHVLIKCGQWKSNTLGNLTSAFTVVTNLNAQLTFTELARHFHANLRLLMLSKLLVELLLET